jgi:hypothetical protein
MTVQKRQSGFVGAFNDFAFYASVKDPSDVKGQKTEVPLLYFVGISVIFILVRYFILDPWAAAYCHMDFFFSWFLYRHPNIVTIAKKGTTLLVPFVIIVGILFGPC